MLSLLVVQPGPRVVTGALSHVTGRTRAPWNRPGTRQCGLPVPRCCCPPSEEQACAAALLSVAFCKAGRPTVQFSCKFILFENGLLIKPTNSTVYHQKIITKTVKL